jgi:hypothetical protein
MTIFNLPFNGLLLIDSKDFLPMATGMAQVIFLRNFKSLGKFHGSLFCLPMALFSEAATTKDIIMVKISLWFLVAGY